MTNLTNQSFGRQVDLLFPTPYTTRSFLPNGQVAQLVERGPEKAGVGGSNPSLATKKNRDGVGGKGKLRNVFAVSQFPYSPFGFSAANSALSAPQAWEKERTRRNGRHGAVPRPFALRRRRFVYERG